MWDFSRLPKLPANMKWVYKPVGRGGFVDRLTIQEKRWYGWKTIASDLLVPGIVSNARVVESAIKDCLNQITYR